MIKDIEFPNVLREMADKLENDFRKNICECKDELYEVSCDLVVRFEELEDLKLREYNDRPKVPHELQEWKDTI